MRTKTSEKNKINVITLGCSKNLYDSEVLISQLKANNKDVVHQEDGNIVVINTCGFIENAKQESIDTIIDFVDKKNKGIVDKVYVTYHFYQCKILEHVEWLKLQIHKLFFHSSL